MSLTGLEVFDTTVQKTNEWLQEIMQELGTESRQQAYVALRATLHTLRERLPLEEMVHLGAQLPMLVRGIYYEGWSPSLGVQKWNREEFVQRVFVHFVNTALENVDPEAAIQAVFQVLSRKIAPGEVGKVVQVLPERLRDLWPATERAGSR